MNQPHEYQEVMHWLAESQGTTPQEIRHTVRSSLAIEGIEEIEDWRERIALMIEPLQMQTYQTHKSIEDLRSGQALLPLLTRVSNVEGKALWLGITAQKRGKYRTTILSPNQQDLWLSEAELQERLGLAPGQALDWLTIESQAPLAKWKGKKQEAKGSKVSPWTRLYGLVSAEKQSVWTIAVYALAIGALTLVTPIAVQALVNTVAFGTLLQPLVVLSFMLAAGLLFLAVMQAVQTYLVEMISRRVFVRVVSDFAYRLSRAKYEKLEKYDRARLSNYFFDVLTIQKVLAVLLLDGMAATLSIISGLLLLAVYHPLLLAFDVFLLLGMGLLVFVMGRGALATSANESKKKHEVGALLDRVAHQSSLYKSQSGAALALSQADGVTREYLEARHAHFRITMRQLLCGLAIQVLASTGLLLVGGWLVISQQLTLGQLVASELIVSVLVASMFKIVKSFEKFYDLMASLEKLGKVIDLDLDRDDGIPLPPSHEAVALRCTNIGYKNAAGRALFAQVSITLTPGENLAVLGSEGVGRSALANMLFGLIKPSEGQLYLNDHLYQDLRLQDIRQVVALAREVHLLKGSILDNVQIERLDVSRHAVRKALELSGLLSFVLSLPDGLHTNTKQACLSPQQEKQLMLARALAGQPGLLVIDGLLDQFSDRACRTILSRLNEAPQRPTMVVITNRNAVGEQCQWQLHIPSDELVQPEQADMGA